MIFLSNFIDHCVSTVHPYRSYIFIIVITSFGRVNVSVKLKGRIFAVLKVSVHTTCVKNERTCERTSSFVHFTHLVSGASTRVVWKEWINRMFCCLMWRICCFIPVNPACVKVKTSFRVLCGSLYSCIVLGCVCEIMKAELLRSASADSVGGKAFVSN